MYNQKYYQHAIPINKYLIINRETPTQYKLKNVFIHLINHVIPTLD